MGARQDCQIMGICVSKSYWEFQEHPTKTDPKTGKRSASRTSPAST
jgi:hypothetical protein